MPIPLNSSLCDVIDSLASAPMTYTQVADDCGLRRDHVRLLIRELRAAEYIEPVSGVAHSTSNPTRYAATAAGRQALAQARADGSAWRKRAPCAHPPRPRVAVVTTLPAEGGVRHETAVSIWLGQDEARLARVLDGVRVVEWVRARAGRVTANTAAVLLALARRGAAIEAELTADLGAGRDVVRHALARAHRCGAVRRDGRVWSLTLDSEVGASEPTAKAPTAEAPAPAVPHRSSTVQRTAGAPSGGGR